MTSAERILAAYAESESWKSEHDLAMRCFEAEDFIVLGDLAFRRVTRADADWQERVSSGAIPYNESDDAKIGMCYQLWIEITDRNLIAIEAQSLDGYEIKGLGELRALLAEAIAMLESRSLESAMHSVDDILHLAKGNPRPARYGP